MSSSSWPHPLNPWGLRQTRRGSVLPAAVFATIREHRATRSPGALAALLKLGFGPCGSPQAEAARTSLRQARGWHVALAEDGSGWTARPCQPLAPRGSRAEVVALRP
jgi:hypothetical protein